MAGFDLTTEDAHGAPMHSIAISEACNFISDTFSMAMLNISSLLWADAEHSKEFDKITAKYYSSADLQAQGMDIHAGTSETSEMLAIDPVRSKNSSRHESSWTKQIPLSNQCLGVRCLQLAGR